MINYIEAEESIKEYFKRHARIFEVVDDCANVLNILEKLDNKTCSDCSKKEMYKKGYKDGYQDGTKVRIKFMENARDDREVDVD